MVKISKLIEEYLDKIVHLSLCYVFVLVLQIVIFHINFVTLLQKLFEIEYFTGSAKGKINIW